MIDFVVGRARVKVCVCYVLRYGMGHLFAGIGCQGLHLLCCCGGAGGVVELRLGPIGDRLRIFRYARRALRFGWEALGCVAALFLC